MVYNLPDGNVLIEWGDDIDLVIEDMYAKDGLAKHEAYCHLRKGMTVLDAGANVGVFTLKSAKIVGIEGRVYAVEPEIISYIQLLSNIEFNGYRNIIAFNCGLWNRDQEGLLAIHPYWSGGHAISTLDHVKNRSFISPLQPVQLRTLTTLFLEHNIDHLDFIKIDTEGSELAILEGARRVLDKCYYFAIEVGHTPDQLDEVKDFFSTYPAFVTMKDYESSYLFARRIG